VGSNPTPVFRRESNMKRRKRGPKSFYSIEQRLLSARTPEEYIDQQIQSPLSVRQKAIITKKWLSKNNYTLRDIALARSRHPTSIYNRNQKRWKKFNRYSHFYEAWDKDALKLFVIYNKKRDNGEYIFSDKALAKEFGRTIPAIQGKRHRLNIALEILTLAGKSKTDKRLISLMGRENNELVLLRNTMRKHRRQAHIIYSRYEE
jgi:hypothetical protein